MLPAGVDTKIPSEINFFIIFFLLVETEIDEACLLCLSTETSLIAIDFLI